MHASVAVVVVFVATAVAAAGRVAIATMRAVVDAVVEELDSAGVVET